MPRSRRRRPTQAFPRLMGTRLPARSAMRGDARYALSGNSNSWGSGCFKGIAGHFESVPTDPPTLSIRAKWPSMSLKARQDPPPWFDRSTHRQTVQWAKGLRQTNEQVKRFTEKRLTAPRYDAQKIHHQGRCCPSGCFHSDGLECFQRQQTGESGVAGAGRGSRPCVVLPARPRCFSAKVRPGSCRRRASTRPR